MQLELIDEIAAREARKAPAVNEDVLDEQKKAFEGVSEDSNFLESLAVKEETSLSSLELLESFQQYDDRVQDANERIELHGLRKKYLPYLFFLVVIWLFFVAIMLVLSAFGCTFLADSVLIALITTSTATVVSMFAIAARWLFPPKTPPQK